jgi:DNA-binding NtrC family response regulator
MALTMEEMMRNAVKPKTQTITTDSSETLVLPKGVTIATKPSDVIATHVTYGTDDGTMSLRVPTLAEVEKAHILNTLKNVNGNKSQAAQLLGISLKTIYNKLASYKEKEST